MAHTSLNSDATIAPTSSDNDLDIDLRSFFKIFHHHKFIIISISLIGLFGSLFMGANINQRYKAEAIIAIDEPHSPLSLALNTLPMGGNLLTSSVSKEVEILRSRHLIEELIKKNNLLNDPYFAPGNASSPKNSYIKLAAALGNIWKNISITPSGSDAIIKIRLTADTPEKPAKLLNSLVDLYIQKRKQHKQSTYRLVESWLTKQADKLQKEIKQTGKEIIEIHKKQGFSNLDWHTLAAEEKTFLNHSTIKLKHEISLLESRLNNITHADTVSKKLQEIPEISHSPTVENLKIDLTNLQKLSADLSATYGRKHPRMKELSSKINAARDNLNDEVNVTIANLNKTLVDKKNILKSESAKIKTLQTDTLSNADNDLQVKSLEYELSYKHSLYEETVKALQTLKINALQQNDIQIISPAVIALKPITPSIKTVTALGTFMAFVFALTLCLLIDQLDTSLRSAKQLEYLTRSKCFGLIPYIKTTEKLCTYTIDNPSSIIAESIRSIRSTINLFNNNTGKEHKVISITSSFKSEGKTATCCWLAQSAAKAGQRVILIDCDLRRPNVHRFLQYKNNNSIVDYLTNQAALEDIIHSDPISGMHIIYGSSVPSHALDLVNSDKLKKLVNALKQTYDLVIIDTPASLAVHDPQTLSLLSDLTLYVVRWKKTHRDNITQGIEQFHDLGVNVASLLTHVDVKRHSDYGYGATLDYY